MVKKPSDYELTIKDWKDGQADAVEFLSTWKDSQKAKQLIAPTGRGKTPIKWGAAAELYDQGYEPIYGLTPTKPLQAQDKKIFPPVHLVYGQSNYRCRQFTKFDTRVNDAPCQSGYRCPIRRQCDYYRDKARVNEVAFTSMNFAMFNTDRMYGGSFNPPAVLFVDEGHAVERTWMNALNVTLDPQLLMKTGLPVPDATVVEVIDWCKHYFGDILDEYNGLIEDIKAGAILSDKEYTRLDLLKRVHGKMNIIDQFVQPKNWVNEDQHGGIDLRPITVRPYMDVLWSGVGHIALMSATIPDPKYLAYTLGLPEPKPEDVLEMSSLFDPARMPIDLDHTLQNPLNHSTEHPGSAAWKEMVAQIDRILDNHPKERGIIHTVSKARAAWILKNSAHRNRMVYPVDAEDRKKLLENWEYERRPRVIVSPSFWEGIDLPYEQNSFQIVVKVPYQNLGSPQIRARMERDDRFEPYQVTLMLAQAVGRSMRMPDDTGRTYFLDKRIKSVIQQWGGYLPSWFHNAIVRKPLKKAKLFRLR